MIEYTDEYDIPAIILSLDFEKCFDRVEIGVLISALEYLNIGPLYVAWTKLIYNKPIAAVSNNGFLSNWFEVTRSVKQGGPNSAYYILVIAEVLAIELRQDPQLKGFLLTK